MQTPGIRQKIITTILKTNKDTTVSDPDHILNNGELNNINYGTYTGRGNVTLNVAVGHNNAQTSTHYATGTNLGTITLPDGSEYTAGSAKPAWKAMGQDLNITWNEVYQGQQTSKNLEYMTSNQNSDGKTYYSQTDLFTTDLSVAVEYVGKGTKILNLGDYLDRMPHFKNYLEKQRGRLPLAVAGGYEHYGRFGQGYLRCALLRR